MAPPKRICRTKEAHGNSRHETPSTEVCGVNSDQYLGERAEGGRRKTPSACVPTVTAAHPRTRQAQSSRQSCGGSAQTEETATCWNFHSQASKQASSSSYIPCCFLQLLHRSSAPRLATRIKDEHAHGSHNNGWRQGECEAAHPRSLSATTQLTCDTPLTQSTRTAQSSRSVPRRRTSLLLSRQGDSNAFYNLQAVLLTLSQSKTRRVRDRDRLYRCPTALRVSAYRVGVALHDARYRSVVAHVVQLIRRDKAVVFNPPHRRLDVEGVAPGEAHQLGVARHPVVRRSLNGSSPGIQVEHSGESRYR